MLNTLNGRVWIDNDRDGIQDSQEIGAEGVTVTLIGAGPDGVFGTADDTTETVVTDGSGAYTFMVLDGEYKLAFGGVAGYVYTAQNAGTDDGIDSDADSAGTIGPFTLAHHAVVTYDAGLVLSDTHNASLGDRVWLDTDRDGVQDSGEAGVAGLAVTLMGAGTDGVFGTGDDVALATTTTNASGAYSFTGLTAGRYQVAFDRGGYQFTTANAGSDAADSDADASTGRSHVVTLGMGQTDLTVDAGLYDGKTASIGDRVWVDANRNGLQDAGETGLGGVAVQLLNAAGTQHLSTVYSAADGSYKFSGLAAGQYRVYFGSKGDHELTTANVGGDDTLDSDVATVGSHVLVTLRAGEANTTVDAGYRQVDNRSGVIGDWVWNDANGNGVQDPREVGQAGVRVTLRGAGNDGLWGNADDTTATTTTSSFGAYRFTGLAAGQYQVEFAARAGHIFTAANLGGNDAADSDADASGKSHVISLGIGETNTSVDAGYTTSDGKTAQIGDRAWLDVNRNGVQDAGETGMAGVTVTLIGASDDRLVGTADDVVQGTTVTDASGNYLFTGLAGGQYQVQFGGAAGYQFSAAHRGGNDAVDSDVDASGKSHVISLGIGAIDHSVDAGLKVQDLHDAALGDRVWHDVNRNGVQDAGEAGLSGVTVTLMNVGADGIVGNADDVTVATTTTDADGAYSFTGLGAGEYQVIFGGKTGYGFTQANVGDDAADSDADSAGHTQVIYLGMGQVDTSVDAGMAEGAPCASITGFSSVTEGGSAAYKVTLTSAVQVDTVFKITMADGTAKQTSNGDAEWQRGISGGAWTALHPDGTVVLHQNSIPLFKADGYTLTGQTMATTGPANLSWDFSIEQNGDLVSARSVYVTVKAGQTQSDEFSINAWKETVYVDRDWSGSGYANGTYREALENFSMKLSTTSQVAVCDPNKTVQIVDASIYNLFSPIILDLDGNGVQTTALADATGKFDLLGNGRAVASGWASSGDGLLAVDTNGNGKIDDISELFGGNLGQGFAKLGGFDSNGDGLVDAADAHFAELLVWQDANGNRQTDAGELRTLGEAGIASLNTDHWFQNVEQNGNMLGETSTATRTDGSSIEMIDAYFQYEELPALDSLVEPDNALFDSVLGGGSAREMPAIADIAFDAAGEAQRVIAEAMKQADATLAVPA